MKRLLDIIKKEYVIKTAGFFVFLCLAFRLFCNTTYLFRNVGYDRNHITGIKSESDLDMVYIGGSAAFVYWQPLRAWKDCGFTSYSLATNSIQAENVEGYMKWAEKYQDPQLYVIGVRAFQYYSDAQSEAGLRNGSDGMDMTFCARYEMLNHYFDHRITDENTDILSYYLDIAKYHTNTGNLASSTAWDFIHNEGSSPNKGWEWVDLYQPLEQPVDFITDDRAELLENDTETLEDLLRYCKTLNKDVLFVVCPYAISKGDYSQYNAIRDAVENYGFQFLNTNEYYDEMGIDFAKDFYNGAHVNLFGAKKYTKFLETYICEHYRMPDHRGEEKYSAWDSDAARFLEEETAHGAVVTDLRLDYEKGVEIAGELAESKNLSEWFEIASDSRFTVLSACAGKSGWPDRLPDQSVFKRLGIVEKNSNLIRVLTAGAVSYSNAADGALLYSAEEGGGYAVDIEREEIAACGETIDIPYGKIVAVVIDHTRQKVADRAVFVYDKNGGVLVEHQ